MLPYLKYFIEDACSAMMSESICFERFFKEHDIDFVIVEGIGGALVPYNKKKLVIDIAKELKLPVLIVAENK